MTTGRSIHYWLSQSTHDPAWLADLGGKPMSKGLDLAGGIMFLKEVDMDLYIQNSLDNSVEELKFQFRKNEPKIRYKSINALSDQSIVVSFRDQAMYELGLKFMQREYNDFTIREFADENKFTLTLTEEKITSMENYVINQNMITYEQRVNLLGNKESSITRQGKHRIAIELPGIANAAEAEMIIGSNANLEFRLEAQAGESFETVAPRIGSHHQSERLKRSVVITGGDVASANVTPDPNNPQFYAVNLDLNAKGGKLMSEMTAKNINNMLAVVYVDSKSKQNPNTKQWKTEVTKEIISFATIRVNSVHPFRRPVIFHELRRNNWPI